MSKERGKGSRRPVLVVGQTPPPFHGQALMLERLVNANFEDVSVLHIRLAYSRSMDDVGRFQFTKVVHLLLVILQVYYAKVVYRPRVLYYPPAGPNRVPMWRDIVFLLSTRWMFAKTIFHMQAGGISELYPKLSGLEKWLFRRAYFQPDAVVRLSEFTPEDAKGLQALAEFIVPNCIEDEFGSLAQTPATDPDCPRILYLGTVCETKGILDLLDACQGLRAPFSVDVVGSFQPADFENVVRERIEQLGLREKVTLHGQLTGAEKLHAFSRSDIFCFPSYYPSEAFPCVLVEAMSFELPIVTTRWRGIRSIVDEGETGYMVEPRDIVGIGRQLNALLLDSKLRKKIGKNGRKKFLRRYTTATYRRMMEAILGGLQNCQPPTGTDPIEISTLQARS